MKLFKHDCGSTFRTQRGLDAHARHWCNGTVRTMRARVGRPRGRPAQAPAWTLTLVNGHRQFAASVPHALVKRIINLITEEVERG
jgi:hypothetical protein